MGGLAALVRERGASPRRRAMGLAIAATANVHGLALMTLDEDFAVLADVVDLQAP